MKGRLYLLPVGVDLHAPIVDVDEERAVALEDDGVTQVLRLDKFVEDFRFGG